jgi:hypothetical protein
MSNMRDGYNNHQPGEILDGKADLTHRQLRDDAKDNAK